MSEMHIGKRIKQYRGQMTADELAERTRNPRITRSVIANIESGRKTDPTISQLLDIAFALGVPLAALVVDVQEPYLPGLLPNSGLSVFTMRNIDVLEHLFSLDSGAYADQSPVRAVIRGLRTLTQLDEDVYEYRLAVSDTESRLADTKIDEVQRYEIDEGLAVTRRELKRLEDLQRTTVELLRSHGVNLDGRET